jgi:hypothetical protein
MNMLLAEMKRSLAELDLGLKGDLTMSEPMERLMKVREEGLRNVTCVREEGGGECDQNCVSCPDLTCTCLFKQQARSVSWFPTSILTSPCAAYPLAPTHTGPGV